jgi:hypothetical protein
MAVLGARRRSPTRGGGRPYARQRRLTSQYQEGAPSDLEHAPQAPAIPWSGFFSLLRDGILLTGGGPLPTRPAVGSSERRPAVGIAAALVYPFKGADHRDRACHVYVPTVKREAEEDRGQRAVATTAKAGLKPTAAICRLGQRINS